MKLLRSLAGWFSPRPSPSTPLGDIRRSFNEAAADEEHFPSTIDPAIYHVQLILRELEGADTGRIADIGSGKGRFSKVIKDRHPRAKLYAFDLAEAMLQCVPEGIERCCGSMTALPFATASCDAAFATESLEHAVDIELAVSELCRVVKPGGRVIIIDKNQEHWGRFKTPAWERWFRREELEKLLGRHCRQVNSQFISYWQDVEPDGLFLAWIARK